MFTSLHDESTEEFPLFMLLVISWFEQELEAFEYFRFSDNSPFITWLFFSCFKFFSLEFTEVSLFWYSKLILGGLDSISFVMFISFCSGDLDLILEGIIADFLWVSFLNFDSFSFTSFCWILTFFVWLFTGLQLPVRVGFTIDITSIFVLTEVLIVPVGFLFTVLLLLKLLLKLPFGWLGDPLRSIRTFFVFSCIVPNLLVLDGLFITISWIGVLSFPLPLFGTVTSLFSCFGEQFNTSLFVSLSGDRLIYVDFLDLRLELISMLLLFLLDGLILVDSAFWGFVSFSLFILEDEFDLKVNFNSISSILLPTR